MLPEARMLDTADGVPIAAYDLGGDGPDLLLAHATGFCAAVLSPLAEGLRRHFRCVAFDERFHGASGTPPGRDFSWEGFALDVIAVTEGLALETPYGFGHSCGAAALLLAEEAKPGTFRSLYCYEPVVFPSDTPLDASLDGNPVSAGALRRRRSFGSREEAMANFSAKPPFDLLDPDALAAYVDHGFLADEAGALHIVCEPEDEAQVYAHGFSHSAFSRLGDIACPVTLACGSDTDAFGPDLLRMLQARLARADLDVLPGLGHLGPLQNPGLVAASVLAASAQQPSH